MIKASVLKEIGRHTKEYYKNNYNEFISNTHDAHFMNLEKKLARDMKPYEEALKDYPDIVEKFRTQFAGEIAKKARQELLETMAMINRIRRGEAALGYTTERQELEAMYRLVTRFEFNCYQLSIFKKKYNV